MLAATCPFQCLGHAHSNYSRNHDKLVLADFMMNLFIHCIPIEFWEFNQTYWQLHCSSHSVNAAGVDEFVAFDHDHDDHDHANKIVWIEWWQRPKVLVAQLDHSSLTIFALWWTEKNQRSNLAVVWKKLDFSLCSYAGADKKFDPSQKTRTFAKRLFLRHHPLMILYMYVLVHKKMLLI